MLGGIAYFTNGCGVSDPLPPNSPSSPPTRGTSPSPLFRMSIPIDAAALPPDCFALAVGTVPLPVRLDVNIPATPPPVLPAPPPDSAAKILSSTSCVSLLIAQFLVQNQKRFYLPRTQFFEPQ